MNWKISRYFQIFLLSCGLRFFDARNSLIFLRIWTMCWSFDWLNATCFNKINKMQKVHLIKFSVSICFVENFSYGKEVTGDTGNYHLSLSMRFVVWWLYCTFAVLNTWENGMNLINPLLLCAFSSQRQSGLRALAIFK